MSALRIRRPALGALLWALASLACGGKDDLGSVMLAISTDMYVDKDVSRVDIIVQPEHGPAQSTQVNLFPALEGRFLPGTFSIIEGSDPGEFVRVRLVARQSDRARVVREAALKVPQRRTALLTMPIQWLCDGRVRQEGQQSRSDCDEGYTCVAGSCRLDEVEEALLPTYQSEEVFGGGNATGGGSCFDTLPCFEQSEQPPLDLDTCTLETPVTTDLNVAAVLPPGGDGHCTASACWIPLDASALSGWSPAESSNRVQLPEGLCERVRANTANVRVSHSCPSKAPATPTCGPWTLVGSEPGAEPKPDTNTDTGSSDPAPSAATDALGDELERLAKELGLEVARACGSLGLASPPANPSPSDLNDLCQLANLAIRPIAPLTWYHLPARCWPDAGRQLSCEAACSSGCNPGTLADRCEANSLAGSCIGPCDSRQCLGSGAVPTTCAGACDGNVTGVCQGTCLGSCSGSCAALTADGNCDGHCDDICTGFCLGRVDGSCQGHCDGDPMLPASPCSPGTLCLGSCSTGLGDLRCASQLGTSPCALDGCGSDCNAIGRIDTNCDPATVWLLPPAGFDTTLGAALPGALGDMITIRDARGKPALDEATRWRDRLVSNSNTVAAQRETAQKVVDLLTAALNGANQVLDAIGPARQGTLPGAGPAAISCDVKKSPGLAPLIDDFDDGDAILLPNDGRTGSWSVGQDGTGTLTTPVPPVPAEGGSNGTGFAMRLAGSGFSQWGANLNLEFRSGAAPYDASAHRGIRFSARGTGKLRVIFMQQNLAPGHPCSTCDTASGECGQLYSTDIFLSGLWSQYIIDWPTLVPPTTLNTRFAPDQLMTIQFEAPAPDPFDIWIDDLSFD